MKIKFDVNGNRCLKLDKSDIGSRGFSVQTLGNLPRTHREGIGPWTMAEVYAYVREYGTLTQKQKLNMEEY